MTEKKSNKYNLNIILKTLVLAVVIGFGFLSLPGGASAQVCKLPTAIPNTRTAPSLFTYAQNAYYEDFVPTDWCTRTCPSQDKLRDAAGKCSTSVQADFIKNFNKILGEPTPNIPRNYVDLKVEFLSPNWCERCEPATTTPTPRPTTTACIKETELFKSNSSKDYNLAGATSARWCDQCPPHNELRDDETNKCIAPDTFVTKVNTLITNPANKIVLTDMAPNWCTACSANPDTAALGGSGGNSTTNNGSPNVVGNDEFDRLQNPLGEGSGIGSLTDFIARILEIVIMIGVPVLVLAFIWVGFSYVKAQGNPQKIKENHMALVYVVIGGALLLGASKLATALKDTVEEIGRGNIV